MIQSWFYHHKTGKRVYINMPDDVWPNKFRDFAQTITRNHEKITDHFGINEAAKEVGVKYETAKRYLEILEDHDIIKHSPTLKEDSYILACTPEEEVRANRESNSSQLAAGAFAKVKRVAQNLPRIAARTRELQRRKEIFSKRFWFFGDVPPPPPPFPLVSPDSAMKLMFPEKSDGDKTGRKKMENEEGLEKMKRELNERYKKLRREKEIRRELTEEFERLANL